MPVTIQPGESRTIVVAAKMPKKAGLFTRKVGLLIDDDGLHGVHFRLTGRIKNVPVVSTVAEQGK